MKESLKYIWWLIPVGVILYAVFSADSCISYKENKAAAIKGKIVDKYVKMQMYLAFDTSGRKPITFAPSGDLWEAARIGDSVVKKSGEFDCVLIRGSERMIVPFVKFNSRCDNK